MAHDSEWSDRIEQLKGGLGVDVTQFEIGADISDDDREVAKLLGARALPKPVMAFLKKANGIKLLWKGKVAGKAAQGSVNILPFLKAAVRAGATEESEPLEGVLWDDEFPQKVISQLKEMTVFEEVAGRSAYLAYQADDAEAKLHLIEGDKITALMPDFDEVTQLLCTYAGADGLREHLTHKDWKSRVAADPQLAAIGAK